MQGRDLSDAAKLGQLRPVDDRDDVIDAILRIVFGADARSIVLVGNDGIGKTAIIQAIALAASQRTNDEGASCRLVEFNMGTLQSSPTHVAHNIQELVSMCSASPLALVIFDPALPIFEGMLEGLKWETKLLRHIDKGAIRCLATLTGKDYEQLRRRDPDLFAAFEVVELPPVAEESALRILQGRRAELEQVHSVNISDAALKAAVDLTVKYMPKSELPGKAIAILDHACRRYRAKLESKMALPEDWLDQHTMKHLDTKVSPHDIQKAITEATSIDVVTLDAEAWRDRFAQRMKKSVVGQDDAVDRVASAMASIRSYFGESHSLAGSMVFGGPHGVGKVHTATVFARTLLGSTDDLTVFDMASYAESDAALRLFGWHPEAGGSLEDGAVTRAVRGVPLPILVFSGIEHAHARIFDSLAPVLAVGTLRDAHGNEVNFQRCICIMTINMESAEPLTPESLRHALGERVPEDIADRFTACIPFSSLQAREIQLVLRQLFEHLYHELRPLHAKLRVPSETYKHLVDAALRRDGGLAAVAAKVRSSIVDPVRRAIAAGELTAGTTVEALIKDDDIDVHIAREKPVT